jgi:long-chain acyl-CoA synthetase
MIDNLSTPLSRLQYWVETRPEQVFLRQPIAQGWQELTFSQVWDRASRLAHYLSFLPARSPVAIYSLNCADWIVVDIAILMAGHVSIPIYPTAGESTIDYILKHSDVKLAFIGKLLDWENKSHCFTNIQTLSFFSGKPNMTMIDEIIEPQSLLPEVFQPKPNDLTTIVYTSGTTGHPKGVMLSYRAISSALSTVEQVFQIDHSDRFFSYLPLAHVAERMAVEMASIYFGATVSFVQSLDHFSQNLRSVKPTIFFAVPRIWLKLRQGIESRLGGKYLTRLLLAMPILGHWLKRKLRRLLGFSETRLALSAAASLPKDTLDWFDHLGIEICEAYGLSETAGFSHINLPGKRRSGSVGQPFPNAECMIAKNGEILLKNPSLMEGYYKQPELSAQAIQDGWFRTGDLGQEDSEGYLYITGRVKDIFKTSKGKYVSPTPIENKLIGALNVDHLCVFGANLPQPVAVAVVLKDWTPSFKKQFETKALKVLQQINLQLEKHERIRQLYIVNEDWNTDNGLLTPTLKMRRQPIEERYQSLVQAHRSSRKIIIWCN